MTSGVSTEQDRGSSAATRQDVEVAKGPLCLPDGKAEITQPNLAQGAAPGWDFLPWLPTGVEHPLFCTCTDWFYLNHSLPEIFLSFCPTTWFLVMT